MFSGSKPVIFAMLFGILASPSAFAGNGVAGHITEFPNIGVIGNGSTYTGVTSIAGSWQGSLSIDTGLFSDVKSWSAWPEINSGVYGSLSFTTYQDSKSYSPWVSSVDRTVGRLFPDVSIKAFAIGVCETNASILRSNGFGDSYIFGKDHQISMNVRMDWDIDFSTNASLITEAQQGLERTITCKKWAGAQIPTGPTSFGGKNGVKSFNLTLDEHFNKFSFCKVKLTGGFETQFGNTKVRYQFEHQQTGKKSPVFSATTSANRHTVFSHQYDIPINKNGDESGHMRMVGVNFDFMTGWKPYSMQCESRGPSDFATELPPILSLEVKPDDLTMIDGQICPTRVTAVAGIMAKSHLEGKLIFIGNQYFSQFHLYQLANGHNKQIGDYRELKWNKAGGFGLKTNQQGAKKLKSQTIKMGFNLVNMDDQIVYQFKQKNYKITCRRPKVNPDLDDAVGNLGTAIHVFQASLNAKPRSTLNGAACGVKLNGMLTANAANATITLDIKNEKGQKLREHTVKTNSQKQAHFSDYIDFTKPNTGLWIDQSGKMSTSGADQSGTYSGHFKVVGRNVAFNSNIATYQVKCSSKAPNKLKPQSAKPKPVIPTVGVIIPKTQQKPSIAGKIKKITPSSVARVAKKTKRLDLAVLSAKATIRKTKGSVSVKVANKGNARTSGTLTIQVKNRRGRKVADIKVSVKLSAGATRTIVKRFDVKTSKHYLITSKVEASGDSNRQNNMKRISVSK
ncbi:MAG: hypothetical protein ACI8XU_002118 [Kiritimatiellia bacterium]|jgi:hypothetical protein